jgi:hypothetical protein
MRRRGEVSQAPLLKLWSSSSLGVCRRRRLHLLQWGQRVQPRRGLLGGEQQHLSASGVAGTDEIKPSPKHILVFATHSMYHAAIVFASCVVYEHRVEHSQTVILLVDCTRGTSATSSSGLLMW